MFRRFMMRRLAEIIVSAVSLVLAVSLFIYAVARDNIDTWQVSLAEKLSLAIIVALWVRWVSIIFIEAEPRRAKVTKIEYYEALAAATRRIWICQTWLPGTETEALRINPKLRNLRLLFASLDPKSPVRTRILERDLSVEDVASLVYTSARIFIKAGRKKGLRFNWGHHPGWMAVIDGDVYWGPTPVHVDNHSEDFLFHRHSVFSYEGRFWLTQFRILWEKYSHDYDKERGFNKRLPSIPDEATPTPTLDRQTV